MGVLKRLAVAFLALAAVGGAGFWILTAPQRLDASVLAEAGRGDATRGERFSGPAAARPVTPSPARRAKPVCGLPADWR